VPANKTAVGRGSAMSSIAFFAIVVPLLVFTAICCLGAFGDRMNRRRYGIRDLLILTTIVSVALGLAYVLLHATPIE
jgi:hypothetical protein